jgi:hypothetical protein
VAHCLNYLGCARVDLGDPSGIEDLRASLELAQSIPHHEYAGRAYTNMWQTLERKSRFIAQVMAGDTTQRTVDDLGNEQVLSYAEVKALATGSPLVKEAAEVDTELARLRRLRAAHDRDQRALTSRISSDQTQLAVLATRIADTRRLLAARTETRGDAFALTRHTTAGPRTLRDRNAAGAALLRLLRGLPGNRHDLGRLAGVNLAAEPGHGVWCLSVAGHGHNPLVVKIPDLDLIDPGGLIARLENQARRLDDILDGLTDQHTRLEQDITRATALRGQPFPHNNRLHDLEARKTEITAELERLSGPTPAADCPGVPGLVGEPETVPPAPVPMRMQQRAFDSCTRPRRREVFTSIHAGGPELQAADSRSRQETTTSYCRSRPAEIKAVGRKRPVSNWLSADQQMWNTGRAWEVTVRVLGSAREYRSR